MNRLQRAYIHYHSLELVDDPSLKTEGITGNSLGGKGKGRIPDGMLSRINPDKIQKVTANSARLARVPTRSVNQYKDSRDAIGRKRLRRSGSHCDGEVSLSGILYVLPW
ncbi:hypothetical protein NPIL_473491 [Nephila pilipes]|uniref:Uncharacterized protein n=1 Tax=Nephila pilipes TaxID=299642 RepID=A0A8X6N1J7_NEPPI|nr:hypothetical protein NPIL_473491 [Nephila pilipes]